ncbi:Ribonuclease R [Sporomusa silvacetica DSM 10669]|uniref:Ribonuclease R n=1 Tax=Sporomusa silvacetica DSM 10669 TaxID=1123289 RepID=A0ABZ3IPN1_9FIRM|nr:RNB domain-containing ribonuclease [Sporomusa silvacetica]OZC23448.1 ribonuclease R [Sporomusa silvacetica DSM 10669]
MSSTNDRHHRSSLQRIARQVMLERGLFPDFSPQAIAELNALPEDIVKLEKSVHDLRNLLWCSIDNDDSNDLDQLTVSVVIPGEAVKVLVAIADVDTFVKKSSAIDQHAQHNTTSVYTAAQIFPMLPEKLSYDLTSLNYEVDRLAIVIEIVITDNGTILSSDIYRAIVRNRAKLTYNSVAAWLDGNGPIPQAIAVVPGLADNIRLQYQVAQKLKALRHMHGALDFETIEARPIFDTDEIKDFEVQKRNSAREIIEDFMIAANGVTARYLEAKKSPSLRRVVRTPKKWEQIVEIARQHNFALPRDADPKALEKFLTAAKAADLLRFPDLSLSIIKLMGAGEYVVEVPGDTSFGHFGLAVKDYAHSTAPNRRYPDLITQRLLKAAISGSPIPYQIDELELLAKHCTYAENVAQKVERQVSKSAAAILLESRIGEKFDAIITGAAEKGTWARLLHPPVEGKLIGHFAGESVGQRVRVQLIHTNVEQGHIDFKKI